MHLVAEMNARGHWKISALHAQSAVEGFLLRFDFFIETTSCHGLFNYSVDGTTESFSDSTAQPVVFSEMESRCPGSKRDEYLAHSNA